MAACEAGELATRPLPRLLLDLHRERFEGALSLTRERVCKRFLLQKGVPLLAESNLASEGLTAYLCEAGLLDAADRARAEESAQREGGPEARALLALGMVDAKTLFHALREQLRLRLIECFGWSRGEFRLDPSSPPPDGAQPFRIDVYATVREGLATHWPAERMLEDLAARMQRYPSRSDGTARVAAGLAEDEESQALLAAIDGEQSLWQLTRQAASPRALATLWLLDATGALRYSDAPGSQAPASAEPQIEIVVASRPTPEPSATATPPPPRATASRSAPELDQALGDEIEQRFAALAAASLYEILGVSPQATEEQVKEAYLAAARRYHPDLVGRAGLTEETRQRANKLFAAIGRAYAVLSDPRKRRDYDESASGDADFDAERLATAEGLYRKGEVLLRQGNFKGALGFLEPAVEVWPDECAYQSALGWALYKKLPSEPERAREHLERAFALDGQNSEAAFRLGVVRRALAGEEP